MLIAILEHYFNLSTFIWVFLVNLHLYRMVTECDQNGSFNTSFYYLIGYITPLVIVGLSFGIKHDIYTNFDSTINFLNYPMNKLDLSSV